MECLCLSRMRLNLLQRRLFNQIVAAVAQHRVGFARTGLSIHENRAVDSVQSVNHDVCARLFVDVPIALKFPETAI